MLIVPNNDELVVEVRINPADIDQLHTNQSAVLRFSAFNQQTTPEISGTVVDTAADLTVDRQTGVGFYLARIAATKEQLARLGTLKLVPGMPAEVFIRTQERTALSYFVKPISDQMKRAFRED